MIAINMRLLKFFLVFAFLLCLMKPCLVEAEIILPPGGNDERLGRGIRSLVLSELLCKYCSNES